MCVWTASCSARQCLPACVWHGAISVSGISPEGMPLPNRSRHPLLSYCKYKCVCAMLAWQRAILPSVPLPPRQRCLHTVADCCPGTSSRLCPGKQMAISDKSSEMGLAVVDDRKVAPSPQAGAVPVGWHTTAGVERSKQSNSGQRTAFSTRFFFNSHNKCITYSFGVPSISPLAILLRFPPAIDI